MEAVMNARKKEKIVIFYGKFGEHQLYDWIPNHLLYLGAALRNMPFEPVIIAQFIEPNWEDLIRQHAPDALLFGISAMSGEQITNSLKAAAIMRECAPDTPIAWGGAHTSAHADIARQTLEHPLADIAFSGNSEISLAKVLFALRNNDDLRMIPGIYLKRDGQIQLTGCAETYDLMKLPPFPYHLLDIRRYVNPKTHVLNYTASAGCPGICEFCSWADRHLWHHLDPVRAADDIEFLVRSNNLNSIWINDADFFFKKDFVMAVAKGIKDRNLGIFWRASGRVVDVRRYTREDFEFLASTGLDNIFLGIESTSVRMMKLMKKFYQVDFVDQILRDARDFPIDFYMSFIYGIPTETVEDLETNFSNLERWKNLSPHVQFQTVPFTPYPGVALTDLACQHGLKLPQTLEDWGRFAMLDGMREGFPEEKIPWFSEDESKRFLDRFNQLFPTYPAFQYKEISEKFKYQEPACIA